MRVWVSQIPMDDIPPAPDYHDIIRNDFTTRSRYDHADCRLADMEFWITSSISLE